MCNRRGVARSHRMGLCLLAAETSAPLLTRCQATTIRSIPTSIAGTCEWRIGWIESSPGGGMSGVVGARGGGDGEGKRGGGGVGGGGGGGEGISSMVMSPIAALALVHVDAASPSQPAARQESWAGGGGLSSCRRGILAATGLPFSSGRIEMTRTIPLSSSSLMIILSSSTTTCHESSQQPSVQRQTGADQTVRVFSDESRRLQRPSADVLALRFQTLYRLVGERYPQTLPTTGTASTSPSVHTAYGASTRMVNLYDSSRRH